MIEELQSGIEAVIDASRANAERALINRVLRAATETTSRDDLIDKIIAISDEVYAK